MGMMPFRDRSLLVKLVTFFLAVTMVPLLTINYIWFKTTSKILDENALQSSSKTFKQINQDISNSLEEINRLALSILYNEDIFQILSTEPENILVKIRLQDALSEKLMRANVTSPKIALTSIIGNGINASSSTIFPLYELMQEQEWYRNFVESNRNSAFTNIHDVEYATHVYFTQKGEKPVFSYLRNIIDISSGKKLGVLVIDIKASVIDNLLSVYQDGQNGSFIVFDNTGNLVYSHNLESLLEHDGAEERIFRLFKEPSGKISTVLNGKRFMLYYSTLPYTDWKIANIISWDTLMYQSLKVQRITIIIEACVVLLVVITGVFLSLYISRPLMRLVKSMKQVEKGELDITLQINSRDEVGQLGAAFNKMLAQIKKLISEVYEEQNKKRDMELKALQAQINPHFLYNTLNTIRWMAVIHKAENISDMIVVLIKLLEFSGKKSKQYVSIREEIEHVNNYVYLQKIRYGDKFTVEYDLDESLLEFKTIKFILQPIVENAIFHGIEPKNGTGVIKITLSKVSERLRFQVIDDGVGMDIKVDSERKFSGLGIENVNERLKINFGPDSALKIESNPGVGTKVEFFLPSISDESEVMKYA